MSADNDTAKCLVAGQQVLGFFAALDQREHDQVAAMMADDGIWHRQGKALQGPNAVAQALAARDPARHTAHVITNLRAESLDPVRIRVRFYLTAYESRTDGAPEATAPRLVSIRACEDELALTPAGWRFASKTSKPLLPPAAVPR